MENRISNNKTDQFKSNEEIRLQIPQYLFDNWVENHLPSFQNRNRKLPESTVLINFSKCQWVTPLPLLAIILEIISYSESGRYINVNLGGGENTERYSSDRNRTRKFLSSHGFISALCSREDLNVRFQYKKPGEHGVWYERKEEINDLLIHLEKSEERYLYGDSLVLPATCWKLPTGSGRTLSESVRVYIQNHLKIIDKKLFKFKTEARKFRDVTLQCLTQVLLELVENAAEHAYENNENAYVGIYIRVRQRVTNSSASKYRNKELANSPLLKKIISHEQQTLIELYVLDVGKGLLSDVNKWNFNKSTNIDFVSKSHPLQSLASVLFHDPLSRHNRSQNEVIELRGNTTGLVHIHHILSLQQASSRIITNREWLAEKHPRPEGYHPNTLTPGGYNQQKNQIKGTFFHLGINFLEIPELDSSWLDLGSKKNNNDRSFIIKNFSKLDKKPDFDSKNKVINVRAGEGLKNIKSLVYEHSKQNISTIIRVHRVADKNLINSIMTSWINGIRDFDESHSFKRQNPILYLCDLGRFQAIDLVWMLPYLNRRLDTNILRYNQKPEVYIATEDLCFFKFSLLVKNNRTKKESYSLKLLPSKISLRKFRSNLCYLLEQLRLCDSSLLWQCIRRLDKENIEESVLLRNVEWDTNPPKVLPVFLNFSVLVQDREAARYVRRGLRRLMALFPEANDLALDALVDSTLHDAKKWLLRPPNKTDKLILVGSLSVSGSTLKNYVSIQDKEIVGIIDCISTPYFNYDLDSRPHIAALLWDPNIQTNIDTDAKYRRIKKSAFVEKISTKKETKKVFFDEDLYQELEVNHLIKVGHWCYGNRHSLLELNIELAIEQSGASLSGPVLWLARQVSKIANNHDVVLAFPIDRLAYQLAHQVKNQLTIIKPKNEISYLPLSFFPRLAGGVTKIAPLVLDSAKDLSLKGDIDNKSSNFSRFWVYYKS